MVEFYSVHLIQKRILLRKKMRTVKTKFRITQSIKLIIVPMSQKFILNPSAATDLILKPAVGVTCVTSSEANCFNRVVLPELSKPKRRIRTSFSGAARNFRNNDNKPYQRSTKFHINSNSTIKHSQNGFQFFKCVK